MTEKKGLAKNPHDEVTLVFIDKIVVTFEHRIDPSCKMEMKKWVMFDHQKDWRMEMKKWVLFGRSPTTVGV